jgi:threonylcarbamoyladenosine tRNA methylthiotransferase MtaB
VEQRRSTWLNAQQGQTKSVLVEKSGRSGHAEDFAIVELSEDAEPGSIISAQIHAVHNGKLQGMRVQ